MYTSMVRPAMHSDTCEGEGRVCTERREERRRNTTTNKASTLASVAMMTTSDVRASTAELLINLRQGCRAPATMATVAGCHDSRRCAEQHEASAKVITSQLQTWRRSARNCVAASSRNIAGVRECRVVLGDVSSEDAAVVGVGEVEGADVGEGGSVGKGEEVGNVAKVNFSQVCER